MSDEETSPSTSTSTSSSSLFSPATRDFLAGLGAGVASVVVGQPLDTLRINEQAATATGGTAARGSSSFGGAGPLATARRLLSPSSPGGGGGGGGPRALWRGVAYPAATIGFQSAIVFQAYGVVCRLLAEREGGEEEDRRRRAESSSSSSSAAAATADAAAAAGAPLSYSSVFLAGTVSGVAQLAVIVPVDLLKIRAQLSSGPVLEQSKNGAKRPFSSFLSPLASAVSSAWRDGGSSVRGLYRGGLVTALRDVPSHGVYFACYELCRELFDPGSRSRSLSSSSGSGSSARSDEEESTPSSPSSSSLALLAAGGIAGAASWLSVYPLDVIKTRVQAATLPGAGASGGGGGGAGASGGGGGGRTSAAATALREAVRAGGLWNGLSSTLARAFVVNAVLFYSYESLIELMGGRDPSDASAAASASVGGAASSSTVAAAAAAAPVATASSP